MVLHPAVLEGLKNQLMKRWIANCNTSNVSTLLCAVDKSGHVDVLLKCDNGTIMHHFYQLQFV